MKIHKAKRWKRQPEILLGPPIPLPMHGMAPRIVLGPKWWNKTRKAAYASTGWHCLACGVHKSDAPKRWLEAHERYEVDYLLGRMTYLETVPLCHHCHNYCHPGRMRAMVDNNEMTHAKYALVIQHGDAVLKAARMKKPETPRGPFAEAEDWRLVIDGVEYARKDYV